MPAVSVIVPNYNHAGFLRRRLDSILCQTFTDFEVIVLDDASSDNSCEVISGYLTDSRVRFYPNKTNSGSPFAQWNRGVDLAAGEYVWIAESDDYCTENFLSTLVAMLDEHRKIGLAYCQSWRVGAEGQPMGSMEDWTKDLDPVRWHHDYLNDGIDECRHFLIRKNTIPNASAVLFRRSTYLQAGGAPSDMRLCGDWLTWVRILLISGVGFTGRHMNYYRRHPSSVASTTKAHEHFQEKWVVRKRICETCPPPFSLERMLWSETLSEFCSIAGQMRGARSPRTLLLTARDMFVKAGDFFLAAISLSKRKLFAIR
jgi:glycosyltransferase involved in cell wall biosynthesis